MTAKSRPINYYSDLDRAYRAMPGTCAFILETLMRRYRISREELDADIRARFGHDFH